MKPPAQQMTEALSRAGLPATVFTLQLDPGRVVTVALTLTENPYGDIHERSREPLLKELHTTLTTLGQWVGGIETL